MKDSTKKTLLLLCGTEKNPNPALAIADLPLLLPELSKPGIRSLVHWWQSHHLVNVSLRGGVKVLVSTDYGQLLLAKTLPGLAPGPASDRSLNPQIASQTAVLILRQPPKADPGFRALRALLKSHQATLIGRGSYVLSGPSIEKVRSDLLRQYPTNVWLLEVDRWLIGSYHDLLLAQPSLIDGLEGYSGVSKETESLLIKYDAKKGLIDSNKNRWYSLYHRFYLISCENTGIIAQFLPPEQQPLVLLAQFQQILSIPA